MEMKHFSIFFCALERDELMSQISDLEARVDELERKVRPHPPISCNYIYLESRFVSRKC